MATMFARDYTARKHKQKVGRRREKALPCIDSEDRGSAFSAHRIHKHSQAKEESHDCSDTGGGGKQPVESRSGAPRDERKFSGTVRFLPVRILRNVHREGILPRPANSRRSC